MLLDFLAVPSAVLVSLTGFVLLISRDWRISILALAAQYAGVFILVTSSWSVEMATVKLVAGWMAGAVLGMALTSLPKEIAVFRPLDLTGILFRFILTTLVLLVMISLAPRMARWVPGVVFTQSYAGAIMIGLGLIHLGLTANPLRVILGLLTVFSGFEVLYAAVEASILVAGLLAGINLGLALVGAYLLTALIIETSG
jgi:hypothetical protein